MMICKAVLKVKIDIKMKKIQQNYIGSDHSGMIIWSRRREWTFINVFLKNILMKQEEQYVNK